MPDVDFHTASDGINVGGPPRVDPVIPDSVGGLLAEEWTIDPSSTLPSYLERMMMEEARRSGIETLKALFAAIDDELTRLTHSIREAANAGTRGRSAAVDGGSSLFMARLPIVWLRLVTVVANMRATRTLRYFGPEARLLLTYFLERRSLLSPSSATISEALYGGKRVQLGLEMSPADGGTTTTPHQKRRLLPMSKQNAIRLALLTSLGPYLEERSGSLIQTITSRIPSMANTGMDIFPGTAAATLVNQVQIILNVVFPLLRMTTRGTFLLYQWRYLIGRSAFFDPYSSMLDLVLRRVTVQDKKQLEPVPVGTSRIETPVSTGKLPDRSTKHDSWLASNALLRSLRVRKLIFGIVSTTVAISCMARIRSVRHERHLQQGLRQLRQEEEHHERASSNRNDDTSTTIATFSRNVDVKQTPPPPSPPIVQGDKLLSIANRRPLYVQNVMPTVCPLCQGPRIHPTASTGGYVFCLKCLLTYIRHEASHCPVTGKPCPESSIIRLYEPRIT